jgi:hypothetical protein
MPIFRERELRFMLGQTEAKSFVAPKIFRKVDHEAMAEGLRPHLTDLETVVVVGGAGPTASGTPCSTQAFRSTTRCAPAPCGTAPGRTTCAN